MATHFESTYPHITRFVQEHGWIEMGYDADSPLTSFLRAVHMGGMVWEGKDDYDSVDDAFRELNAFLRLWLEDQT